MKATAKSLFSTKVPEISSARTSVSEDLGELRTILIRCLSRADETQCRVVLDPQVVNEYAELMRAGTRFPPVSVWTDRKSCWLADGFHRVAAAEQIGRVEIEAEIRCGTLNDARWDSYRANSIHGLRRSAADIALLIERTLQHPNSALLSTNEIAKHLNIPEATLRRHRGKISSSIDEDATRVAVRAGRRYKIRTGKIGKASRSSLAPTKSPRDLRHGLAEIKSAGSREVRRVLSVIEKWAFGPASLTECHEALERIFLGYKNVE